MKMNKVVLSLAGVLAAAAFAPEASAVPVFARQTGMACSACHFNHFPLLNAFGRSFKASGYTLMGAQGKVEGEELSIPDRVNMGVLITAGWEGQSNSPNGAVLGTSGFYVPTNGGEFSLFLGGKVTDNSGFLSEVGLGGAAVTAGTAKFLFLPEVAGNTRVGFSVFSIGQDAAGSFELLNTGATSIHRLMGNTAGNKAHLQASSAKQYVTGAEAGATGVGIIAVNTDMGFLNVAKYATVPQGSGIATVAGLPGTYIRAAGFFNMGGFEGAAGIQNWSGYQAPTVNGATFFIGEEKATVVDFQMQGEVGGHGLGVYASYATAPVITPVAGGTTGNRFNAAGTVSRKALTIAADYTVMHGVTLQGSYRAGTEGTLGQGDNALMIGAAYELAQNQHLGLNYTTQSGSAWGAGGVNAAVAGKNVTTVLLESLF